jgi:hypothetical protein
MRTALLSALYLLALCGAAVAPTWAPRSPDVQDLRSRDTVALHAGGWTLELEVRGLQRLREILCLELTAP